MDRATKCDQDAKETLGVAPGILAKKKIVHPVPWCPKPVPIEVDPYCDPDNPINITYRDVLKATKNISEVLPKTPMMKSKCCSQFDLEMFYKVEVFYKTGSYNERTALYALSNLKEEDRTRGVITASLGNWALALAHYGKHLNIPVTVVLPSSVPVYVVRKCHELGAFVVSYGENLDDAMHQAFVMIKKRQQVFINGYDHPDVIAAAGSIGIEILEEVPQVDAIIVPVGGGGLLAGVAAAVKHIKPDILVYGIQTKKSSAFFKAMEIGAPQQTAVEHNLATSLMVPTAGYNAYHTAKSLVDKMVLITDDQISRAMLHLVEEEKLVVEGAAAASLGAFMCVPDILPELKEKTVVCILTGGNVDTALLPRCLERAKIVEGRILKLSNSVSSGNLCNPTLVLPFYGHRLLKVRVTANNTKEQLTILRIIANVGANVVHYHSEKPLLADDDYDKIYLKVLCETRNIEHACSLKRVMDRLFPQKCQFLETPFKPTPICACFPRRINI